MTYPHAVRRLAAAATLGVLLVTAACTPAPAPSPSPSALPTTNWDEFGPIVYAQGKDASGTVRAQVDEWNRANPNEQVEFRELSDAPGEQRAAMVQRAQAKSGEFAVMSLDVVWTAEFAANGWLEESSTPPAGYLSTAVDSASYADKPYATPFTSDAGLLHYRKDLLDQARLKPPTTWKELRRACDKVLRVQTGMACYGGQFEAGEGLTANMAEAIDSAGGAILDENGKPTVNTTGAVAGLTWLVDGFTSGMIPAEAKTWTEEDSRAAFQDGKVLFLRGWSTMYRQNGKEDGPSGRFAVAPLPGKDGPGVPTLGGYNLGISTFARNKGTALKFVTWMQAGKQQQRRLEDAGLPPVLEQLYDDAALQAKIPGLTTVADAVRTARPRPKAARYSTEVSVAIQDAARAAIRGDKDPRTALADLQARLEVLIG